MGYIRKICCTCIHCKRIKTEDRGIRCECDVTGKYLSYLAVMDGRCKQYELDPWQKGGKNGTGKDGCRN